MNRPEQREFNAELTSESPQMDRRSLLAHLAKIGATSLIAALGGSAIPKLAAGDQPGTSAFSKPAATTSTRRKFRYGMVIDTRRCVGCKACVVACKAENKTPPGVTYTVVLERYWAISPDDKPLFMTKPCFHCENPRAWTSARWAQPSSASATASWWSTTTAASAAATASPAARTEHAISITARTTLRFGEDALPEVFLPRNTVSSARGRKESHPGQRAKVYFLCAFAGRGRALRPEGGPLAGVRKDLHRPRHSLR